MAEHNPPPAGHGEPVTCVVVESLGPRTWRSGPHLTGWRFPCRAWRCGRRTTTTRAARTCCWRSVRAAARTTRCAGGAPHRRGRRRGAGRRRRSRHGAPPGAAALAEPHGVALMGLPVELEWAEVIGSAGPARARSGPAAGTARRDLPPAGPAEPGEHPRRARARLSDDLHARPGAAGRLPADRGRRRHAEGAVLEQRGQAGYRSRLAALGVYRRLWSDEGVVDVAAVPELGAGRRLAVAVRAGKENRARSGWPKAPGPSRRTPPRSSPRRPPWPPRGCSGWTRRSWHGTA